MENILVRTPNWIGDQILAYPFFYGLRKKYPKAKITAVCLEWVKDIQFLNCVDDVYTLPLSRKQSFFERLKWIDFSAKELKQKKKWDLGIALPNSISSAWLLYRAGVKSRRGYGAEGRSILLNDTVDWKRGSLLHRSQAYFNLIPHSETLSFASQNFWPRLPDSELDSKIDGELDAFDVQKEWPSTIALEPPQVPYYVIAPGSQAVSRTWPVEYFADFAALMTEKTSLVGVIVGGPKETSIASRLMEDKRSNLLDYTAKGNVSSLWKIFKNAKWTLCNESGLAHVAALCGSPVQIVCGAADPRRTRPLGPASVMVKVNPLSCWPCEKNICYRPAHETIACLKGILPQTIYDEISANLIHSS